MEQKWPVLSPIERNINGYFVRHLSSVPDTFSAVKINVPALHSGQLLLK